MHCRDCGRRTNIDPVLAAYPTWLVMKEHVPVETDKFAAAQNSDEEAAVGAEPIRNEEKDKLAVGQTGIGRDAAI